MKQKILLLLSLLSVVSVSVQTFAQSCEAVFVAQTFATTAEPEKIYSLTETLAEYARHSAMSRYTPADLSLQSDAILQNTTEENVKYLLNAGSMADSPLPEAEKDLFLGFTAETQARKYSKLDRNELLTTQSLLKIAEVRQNFLSRFGMKPNPTEAEKLRITQVHVDSLHKNLDLHHGNLDLLVEDVAKYLWSVRNDDLYLENANLANRVAYILLLHLDIPPPRTLDVVPRFKNMTEADAVKELRHSIAMSSVLLKDLGHRNYVGLPLKQSPWLYLPALLADGVIFKKKQGQNKTFGEMNAHIDAEQWLAYVVERLRADASLRATAASNPHDFLAQEIAEYREFFHRTTVQFEHDKEGTKIIGLHFADLDFVSTFMTRFSNVKEVYDEALHRWYSDDIIWRGHGFRDREFPESDIIRMFSNADLQLASNPTIGMVRAHRQEIGRMGLTELARYNASVLNGQIFTVADDHHKMGPGYQDSFGFSTSKSFDVARAFAFGAMKVAEYGKQNDAAVDLVKTRLVVGVHRANHYIEMGRLKPIDEHFSYTYGRQQEVMGIGVAEPESIAVVKTINPDKTVQKSYLRDPEKPWIVLVISGDVEVGQPIPQDRVEKSVSIRTP